MMTKKPENYSTYNSYHQCKKERKISTKKLINKLNIWARWSTLACVLDDYWKMTPQLSYIFFGILFSQGMQHQPEPILQLSPDHDTQCIPIYYLGMAEAMVYSFLLNETTAVERSQPGLEPGHQPFSLTITRLMPWRLGYCCPRIQYSPQAIAIHWIAGGPSQFPSKLQQP